jgi:hypothetical protein
MQTLQLANGGLMNPPQSPIQGSSQNANKELYAQGVQEIFGKRQPIVVSDQQQTAQQPATQNSGLLSFEINPLKVACSKLPMALRNRKFGRPSFHNHSEAESARQQPITATR